MWTKEPSWDHEVGKQKGMITMEIELRNRVHGNICLFVVFNHFWKQVQPYFTSPVNFRQFIFECCICFKKLNRDFLLFALKNSLGKGEEASTFGYPAHLPRAGPASQVADGSHHLPCENSSLPCLSAYREGSSPYTANITEAALIVAFRCSPEVPGLWVSMTYRGTQKALPHQPTPNADLANSVTALNLE